MEDYFSTTCIGYNHIKEGIGCQDYSACYKDNDCIVLTACDGHGGKMYIRSDKGSKFASFAAMSVLLHRFRGNNVAMLSEEDKRRLKLELLCEWNGLVERDYAEHPFSEDELSGLDERQKSMLENSFAVAYGTTLNAVYIAKGLQIFVNIGDGEIFAGRDKNMAAVFEDDEHVANLTYSLCSDDAFEHLRIKATNMPGAICILLCTDGVVNPYLSYENFSKSFILPVIEKVSTGNSYDVIEYINELGREKGIGDDVSLALYYTDGNTANIAIGNDEYASGEECVSAKAGE